MLPNKLNGTGWSRHSPKTITWRDSSWAVWMRSPCWLQRRSECQVSCDIYCEQMQKYIRCLDELLTGVNALLCTFPCLQGLPEKGVPELGRGCWGADGGNMSLIASLCFFSTETALRNAKWYPRTAHQTKWAYGQNRSSLQGLTSGASLGPLEWTSYDSVVFSLLQMFQHLGLVDLKGVGVEDEGNVARWRGTNALICDISQERN